MKAIKKLVKLMYEELEDSQKYAELALKYKDDDSALADTFHRLSGQEMEHLDMLHSQAVRLIKAQDPDSVPKGMREIWDWEHERLVDWKAKVKHLQDFYRN